MSKKSGKLVRDKIPEIIKKNNQTPTIKILKESEYVVELRKKLLEEITELLEAKDKDELINESGDVLEIIDAIAQHNNITFKQILESKEYKKKERGSFKKRIYLVSVK